MATEFVWIGKDRALNLAHVVSVDFSRERYDDSGDLYILIWLADGEIKCFAPFIDNLKRAIADRIV